MSMDTPTRDKQHKHVLCSRCFQPIHSEADLLLVAHWGIDVRAYCAKCYARQEKGFVHHHRTGSYPLNSTYWISTAIMLFLAVAILTPVQVANPNSGSWGALVLVWVVFVWNLGLRAWSYYSFERHFWAPAIRSPHHRGPRPLHNPAQQPSG